MDISNPANLLIAGIYYVLVILLSFFSIFGLYILIRYGKSTPFALTVAIVYSLFFLKILSESYQTLNGLLS
jgi:hypothetical protein